MSRSDHEAIHAELGADDGVRIFETAAKWAVIGVTIKWVVIGGALVFAASRVNRGRR